MIPGIQMSKVKIAILETKIERLVEKQKELTERVRSNEKFIAGVGAVATLAVALLGFMGSADASPTAGEWIQKLRDHESEQTRTTPEESINNSLQELEWEEDGSNGSTVKEELLQLPSNGDSESTGRRYDRCSDRSWIRFIQERTGKSCGCGHTREEN